jgi:hypothetical protein
MDQELKAKWVTALRSGKYKQARNELSTPKGYCCLGVLARIMQPRLKRVSLEYPNYGTVAQHDQYKLANMNDGHEGEELHNFKQIADHVEANL